MYAGESRNRRHGKIRTSFDRHLETISLEQNSVDSLKSATASSNC